MEHKEVPPLNAKQPRRMTKKLGKLNRKISHSKKKHNNLISERNSIKKKIEEMKGPSKPEVSSEPEESFNPVESLSKRSIGLIGVIELMEVE